MAESRNDLREELKVAGGGIVFTTIQKFFPEEEEERRILKENLPFVDEYFLEYVVNFLQKAHAHQENYTIRDGINIARYAAKRIKSLDGNRGNFENLIREAILMTLGDEALAHIL